MDKLSEIKNRIVNNEIIKKIITKLDLNKNQIESGYDIFLRIIEENENINDLEYITEVEIYDENRIVGISVPNKNSKLAQVLKRKKNYWLSGISNVNPDIRFSNPKLNLKNNDSNLFFWTYPKLKIENDRSSLALWFKDFYTNWGKNKKIKGIYISGMFGLGKTYFLMAFTNYLIDKNITVSFLNINELYDYMTRNLNKNNELNYEAIDKMKNVEVLIIDDIGSEKANDWFLFSVLYPVFEYRIKEDKITCFSSIFSISNLKKNWLKSKELDSIKIERLIDKIKHSTIQTNLKGKNIREI